MPDAIKNFISQITEPMTLLTDFILAAFTLVLALKLFAQNKKAAQKIIKFFALALSALSVGVFFSGTYHGFKEIVGSVAADIIWLISGYVLHLIAFFMLLAGAHLIKTALIKKAINVFAWLKLIVFLGASTLSDAFALILADYGISIILLSIIFISLATKNIQKKSAITMLLGFGVSVLAGIIQFSGLSPHKYFNNNDLYHVVQIAGNYLLYLGVKKLKDI